MHLARLLGTAEIRFSAQYTPRVINLFLREGREYLALRQTGSEAALAVWCWELHRILGLLEKEGIPIEAPQLCGMLPIAQRYWGRVGILVGILLFSVLVFVSGRIVWQVEVSGNDRLDSVDVLHALEQQGFGVGSSVKAETGAISDRCVAAQEEIAWMSIVVRGTTAHVHILESEDPTAPAKTDLVNLIAERDAVIESVAVTRGQPLVRKGSVVRKGDLLVSGVTPTPHGSVFVGASGSVFGRVDEEVFLKVPGVIQKKQYTESALGKISVNFLGFSTNIFKYTGNFPPVYDTIREEKVLKLFGVSLPFSYTVERLLPYTPCGQYLDEDALLRYASVLLEEKIQSTVSGGEILMKETDFQMRNGDCFASCRISYVTDIAKSKPFSLE